MSRPMFLFWGLENLARFPAEDEPSSRMKAQCNQGLKIMLWLALSAIGTFSGQTGVSTLECAQPRPLCLVLRHQH